MRYVCLQQIGGSLSGAYDIVTGEIIKTYEGKYARDLCAELCDVLNRGLEARNAAIEATKAVQAMSESVPVGKVRRAVLQRKMQGTEA